MYNMENLWEEEGIVHTCVAWLALSLQPHFLACSRNIVNCEGLELQEGLTSLAVLWVPTILMKVTGRGSNWTTCQDLQDMVT